MLLQDLELDPVHLQEQRSEAEQFFAEDLQNEKSPHET